MSGGLRHTALVTEDTNHSSLSALIAQPPEEPRGAFRWPHSSYLVRYPLHVPIPNEEDWEAVEPTLRIADDKLDNQAVALFSKHGWTIGRLGWIAVADRLWARLSEDSRASFLAGLSGRLSSGFGAGAALAPTIPLPQGDRLSAAEFIKEKIGDVTLNPISACELAVNITLRSGDSTVAAILSRPGIAEARVPRLDPLGQREWESAIHPLSDRVADIVFEVALKTNNDRVAEAALDASADPNAAIWSLERSFNERFCALAYAIDHGTPRMVDRLLNSGASPEGTDYGGLNQPLFYALYHRRDELADRLLAGGASFSMPSEVACAPAGAGCGCESEVISPRGQFFGYFRNELDAIRQRLSPLIALTDVARRASHYIGNGQGGSRMTFLNAVANRDDDLARLQKYEERGLDTSLSVEEICALIHADAWNCLAYLLGKHGADTRDRAFFRLRRKYSEFGAQQRWFETEPQDDGINVIAHFDPAGWPSFELPDGSRIHADLSAIAPPGHALGPCGETEFFCREVSAVLRRRGDHVVVTRLSQQWALVPNPFKTSHLGPRGLRKLPRYELLDLLPVVREIGGRFIWLGISLDGVGWNLRDTATAERFHEWRDSLAGERIVAEATRRIAAQDAANLRPPKPQLSEVELDGYPREFWPHLVRLDNGLIGMTEESCDDTKLLARYRAWEAQNKPDFTFVPDPRILEWDGWKQVPEELKPFFVFDPMFDRPGVRHKSANEYEEAMIRKAVRWWNEEWMIPAIREVLEP